jgi:hypothetical protein
MVKEKVWNKGQNKYGIGLKMKTPRLIGIVLALIGWAILVSGAIIPSTIPDYNYAYYTGFRFPTWLLFSASLMTMVGGMLIFYRGKARQTTP